MEAGSFLPNPDESTPATHADLQLVVRFFRDLIHDSEGRIVDRVDQMDTRINGRIRRQNKRIVGLEEWRRSHTWLTRVAQRAAKHPMIVSLTGTAIGSFLTYLLTQ